MGKLGLSPTEDMGSNFQELDQTLDQSHGREVSP